MEIARLAAKQKRIESLKALLVDSAITPDVQTKLKGEIEQLSKRLAECVSRGSVTENDLRIIESIERQLESSHELARLKLKPKKSGFPSRVF